MGRFSSRFHGPTAATYKWSKRTLCARSGRAATSSVRLAGNRYPYWVPVGCIVEDLTNARMCYARSAWMKRTPVRVEWFHDAPFVTRTSLPRPQKNLTPLTLDERRQETTTSDLKAILPKWKR